MPAKNVAYCGLNCGLCPAYLATVSGDQEQKKKVAEEWSAAFHGQITADMINCMGCKSDGPRFSHCSQCGIRACAQEKGLPNCGHCSDYACAQLTPIFKSMPAAQDCLDAVYEARKTIAGRI